MADQSDIEAALVEIAATALYPDGTGEPSVCACPCRVYRGWPNAAALDSDLAAGIVNVSVFPIARHVRNTTRWLDTTLSVTTVAPTLAITVAGDTATVTGVASVGQVAGLLIDSAGFAYRLMPGDYPALVAANLSVLVRATRPASLSGASLTNPSAARVIGRVVADATGLEELRRQSQRFRITCWCPSPDTRDIAAAAIDEALAALTFLTLPDGTSARLRFGQGDALDQSQNAALYRRDLVYDVEYATTRRAALPEMLFGDLLLNATTFLA